MRQDPNGGDQREDLGERQVFEGPETDAAMVQLALEREGIEAVVDHTRTVFSRLHGAVYVSSRSDVERARDIVARHLRGDTSAGPVASWKCPSCKETIEGQFAQCWKCGHAKPA